MMDSPQACDTQNVTAVFPNIYQTVTQEGDDDEEDGDVQKIDTLKDQK